MSEQPTDLRTLWAREATPRMRAQLHERMDQIVYDALTEDPPMTFIITALGRKFDYADIESNQVEVQDIALTLSRESRFNGHTCPDLPSFSVAQHCVHMARCADNAGLPLLAYECLHHDDSEAFMKDLPGPLKRMLPEYKALQHRVEQHLGVQLGLPTVSSWGMHALDRAALVREAQVLVHSNAQEFYLPELEQLRVDSEQFGVSDPEREAIRLMLELAIEPWEPREAYMAFMNEHDRLCEHAVYPPVAGTG